MLLGHHQAHDYIRALYPETDITVFYIDLRTPGRLEEFSSRAAVTNNLRLVKGKVALVNENAATHDLLVTVEDVLASVRARTISNWLCWPLESFRRRRTAGSVRCGRVRISEWAEWKERTVCRGLRAPAGGSYRGGSRWNSGRTEGSAMRAPE